MRQKVAQSWPVRIVPSDWQSNPLLLFSAWLPQIGKQKALIFSLDYETDSRHEAQGTEASGFQAQYLEFLRREMPRRVRQELEYQVEQELNVVEDKMKKKALEIFQNTHIKLLRTFSHIFSSGQPASRSPSPEPVAQGAKDCRATIAMAASSNTRGTPQFPLCEVMDPHLIPDFDPDFAELFEEHMFDFGEYLALEAQDRENANLHCEPADSGYGASIPDSRSYL